MSTVTKNLQTLLNMDPLELAKQLTAMEFGLYSNIKPEEWLLRLRATNPVKSGDNIARIVELSNKVRRTHSLCTLVLPTYRSKRSATG